MADRICTVTGCGRKHVARGFCNRHYLRWQHHGSADSLLRERGAEPPACTIGGCDRPGNVGGRGWCQMHYRRYQRHGSPFVSSRIVGDDVARFESYIVPGSIPTHATELGACWLWTGAVTKDGYGVMEVQDLPTASAHRWSYRHHIGALVDGLELDHLCRVRRCVNPYHLEQVTHVVNISRSNALRSA